MQNCYYILLLYDTSSVEIGVYPNYIENMKALPKPIYLLFINSLFFNCIIPSKVVNTVESETNFSIQILHMQ